jgi:AcrR family transcriptional regulator
MIWIATLRPRRSSPDRTRTPRREYTRGASPGLSVSAFIRTLPRGHPSASRAGIVAVLVRVVSCGFASAAERAGAAAANGALAPNGAGGARPAPLPVPPTQTRGFEKRERIYRAAIARYKADGVDATRVEDVIADAGVSWATFFRYFPQKGDILVEALARHFRDHVRPSASAARSDRRLRMRTVIERSLLSLLRPADLPRSLHTAALLEVFANPARFAAMVGDGHPQPVVGLLAELLTEGQRRGEVRRELDPSVAALTVVAGAALPGAQAAALGADPAVAIKASLDISWRGVASR